jgi:isopentenyl-diphosphate delta-isomerase
VARLRESACRQPEAHEWPHNIQQTVQQLDIPVIIKEVGFGMNRETIQQFQTLGVKAVDVSGRGGTSFSQIENARRKKRELNYLDDWASRIPPEARSVR